ncbi:unnamed protein product, partial [Mesorhabditis belari]|uniref:Methyltransferase FkbM domain-containing protein n=1 Tax=Mesorhabditis belari TaxID=2138241 RepID=A0AAF3ED86_9BILA
MEPRIPSIFSQFRLGAPQIHTKMGLLLPYQLKKSPASLLFSKQGLLAVVYCLVFIYICTLFFGSNKSRDNFFAENHECVNRKTESLEFDELYKRLPEVVNQCSVRGRLNIQGFTNTDETKYHVMPTEYALQPRHDCTIISLGVGKDVEAEKQMLAALPHCKFFGADPVNDTNADIYPEVGKFFNVAVGGSNGIMRANVLEDQYKFKDVPYIDIAAFMRNLVKKTVVDQIMIDIEHAEYPMLPFLLKTGQMYKEGVTICQINIEVHNPSPEQKQEFYKYYHLMMAENQYTMLTASTIIGHIRLFMINHADEECHQRYIGDIYDRPYTTTTQKPF